MLGQHIVTTFTFRHLIRPYPKSRQISVVAAFDGWREAFGHRNKTRLRT